MTSIRPAPHTLFCNEVNKLMHCDPNAIYSLFDLIQAPSTLKAFFLHIPLLREILRAAVEIAETSELIDDQYRQAEETVVLLNTALPILIQNTRLGALRLPVPKPRNGPCEGILTTHPLYSFLAENVPNKAFHKPFVFLQAHVLLAMDSLNPVEGELLESLIIPFRFLRKINNFSFWENLGRLPNEVVPITSYAEKVRTALSHTPFQPIGNIFQIAAKTLGSRKRQRPVRPKVIDRSSSDNIDDEENVPEKYLGSIKPSSTLSEKESAEYTTHGGRPEELGAGQTFEPVLSKDRYHGATRRQLALQAKQASNKRAMINQNCALAWNQANLFDIKVLFEFLEGNNQLEGFDFQPLNREETISILGLIFFTSNSFKRILSLPVFPGTAPSGNSPEGFYYTDKRFPLIHLYSPGPEIKNRILIPGAFQVEQYITIPLPEFFCICLNKIGASLLSGKARPYLFSSIDPIDDNCIKDTHSHLRRALGELNKQSGARLSLGRISSFLLYRMAEARHCDLPSAMLFFGRDDKIVRTRIHYSLVSSGVLETIYRNCCNNLLNSLMRPGIFKLNEVSNLEYYLGTPNCPTPSTVKNIARELQSAVASSIKSTLFHRHNLYALYTAMLISFGTGFRAIHDPSLKEVEIDFEYGVGIICDKGDVSYRSRYVYLAPVVLDQIRYYRQHIQVIYTHLGVINPSLFDMLKCLDYEGLPLNLFWLKGELEPLELLTPGVEKKILATNHQYSIPINAGRHYLKYQLQNADCSPELIEAQLGHWENGQEPWGQYSNLDPMDFIEQMAQYLPVILENDGWRAIRGLG